MAKKEQPNGFAMRSSQAQAAYGAKMAKLERDAAAPAVDPEPAPKPEQDGGGAAKAPRERLALAMSHEDKVKLKTVAAKRGITVAALVHELISDLE